ncbi:hypothetical protein B0O99DRAFT_510941 [Bisporella sp. PMI_857]|nr:hypothetical protein B0O99DRAFT_510941 [Bisporella sp. PMI_857]
MKLHNEYLEAAVSQIVWSASPTTTQALHTWFELEIRNKSMSFNAETMGYMLKASLQSLNGDQKHRLVRRYMDICKQNDLELEVMQMAVLTAEDLNQISHICPDFNAAKYDQEYEFEDEVVSADLELSEDLEEQKALGSDTTPEVRGVPQKGLGLKTLRESLEVFAEFSESSMARWNLGSRTEEEKRQIQARVEESAVEAAIGRWRAENADLKKMGLNTTLQTKSIGSRMWRWHVELDKALKTEVKKLHELELQTRITTAEEKERLIYGPFLRLLPTEKLSAITILSIMQAFSARVDSQGMPLSHILLGIASDIEDEVVCTSLRRQMGKSSTAKLKKADKRTKEQVRRAKRGRFSHTSFVEEGPSEVKAVLADNAWPSAIKAKIGAFLMSAFIDIANIPIEVTSADKSGGLTQLQPAFSHSYEVKKGKRVGTIKAHPVLMEQMRREPVHSLLAKHLPMLVKPEPWTQFGKGGFISQPAKAMRIKHGDKDQRFYAEAAIGKGDMEQTFKGLDVLGSTPWRINKFVFDTMLEAWNTGKAFANIAPENPHAPIPPEPEASSDPFVRKRWLKAVRAAENYKVGQHSVRCFQNFQLEIARALRNEVFYFPHNIDFRGRAYPIPPYLNHIGADHCRGLLFFGNGKELGPTGLKWLKIHLANVFGYDKASLTEREEFATKHIEQIYEVVANPINGSRWWLQAEDPWQFLAACAELKNALESPDPEKFVSHLPVHQDGTCNGLQHYAALGGDASGAKQVNLEPGDRPGDVYTAVADLVIKSIAKDKENGHAVAKLVDGRIKRKIVKQTVMTNVYGVTYIGAKDQVKKALLSLYDDLPNTEEANPSVFSAYIAKQIFVALATMFRGAHDIQYWLGECASRISQCVSPEQIDRWHAEGKPVTLDSTQFKTAVVWTNPLRMPVVQPYRQTKSKVVHTNMQQLNLSEPHSSNPISKRKQLQGLPPNFIHSLDASHMLLSALRCNEKGLAFAAVHDSFWTHAGSVGSMNTILRDCFIKIHSEDVIGRLAAEFSARYRGCFYLAKVRSGTALHRRLVELRKSRGGTHRAKDNVKMKELMQERKRWQLLESPNPAKVEEGKRMHTPGSVFEEMSADGDLAAEDELAEIGLGKLSDASAGTGCTTQPANGTEEFAAPTTLGDDNSKLSHFEKTITTVTSKKGKAKSHVETWVWLPLKFPPVPKRGDFDVSRLRNSQYFFS